MLKGARRGADRPGYDVSAGARVPSQFPVCVCVLAGVLGVIGAGPAEASSPPWIDDLFPDLAVVPVLAGDGEGTAPRMWCTSSQTATFVHGGDPTDQFVRLWVPGHSWLRADEAGRVSLQWYNSTSFQADYDAFYRVMDTSGALLNQTNHRIGAGRTSDTPGMPGWVDWDRDFGVWYNHGDAREVILQIKTTRTYGGGAGLEWRSRFYSDYAGGPSAPACPTSTNPDSETDRPGGCLDEGCAGRTDERDPVDTRTGNFWFPLAGLSVAGRGAGLKFGLMYSSSDADHDGPTGFGWSSLLGMTVREDDADSVTVVEETGATVPFDEDEGVWSAPGRFTAELEELSGGGWVFRRRHFEEFTFDAAGRLVAIADQFGNETTIGYSGGVASFMEDEAGRRLTFAWDGGRLVSVSDDLAGGSRSVALAYNGAGDLVSFTDVGGGVWSFGYDGGHRVVTVRKPRHQPAGPQVVKV